MSDAAKAETNLIIQITDQVWQKVMFWVEKSPVEISGLGKVVYDAEKGVFNVVDAFLVEQENGAAETEMKDQAIAKLMYETHKEPGRLCWWWHSHVNMQAYWSGTDHATIKKLGAAGWVVATVLNKKREYRSAYFQGAPNQMLVDNLPTYVGPRDIPDALLAMWKGEYDQKVTEKKSYWESGNYGRSYGGNYAGFKSWVERARETVSRGSENSSRSKEETNPYGIPSKSRDAEEESIESFMEEYYGYGVWGGSYSGENSSKGGAPEGSSGSVVPAIPEKEEVKLLTDGSEKKDETLLPSDYDRTETSDDDSPEVVVFSETDNDPSSVDPRDGDDTEMDALDLMQRSFRGRNFNG